MSEERAPTEREDMKIEDGRRGRGPEVKRAETDARDASGMTVFLQPSQPLPSTPF